MSNPIEIIPLTGFPIVKNENQLWTSLKQVLSGQIKDGDVLVCAHTPFSRVMGYSFALEDFTPSEQAKTIAAIVSKDPRKIEAILQHSKEIVKIGRNVVIAENHAGVVCANSGIDESNAGLGRLVAVPENPDELANQIRTFVLNELGVKIAVIISDTVGRALRRHAVNIAIGSAGIDPVKNYVGKKDLFGYELKVSKIALADEIASAAELVQGQSDEGIPFVIVRNVQFETSTVGARELNRPSNERLFS
ncbi:MAG: coenzyme F420-0:L-glutamate ligase [Methanobacteriota archaeon]|nr:MAG: coenzyme F420-0:L-glutamate ligase [Euryarchaeota archaeon]